MKQYQIAIATMKERSAQLRDIPLAEVATWLLGSEGKREGDSLLWKTDLHKIVISGQKFKDFLQPQGRLGGGAIDLVMHIQGCDYKGAIQLLAGQFGTDQIHGAIRSQLSKTARTYATFAINNPQPLRFEQLFKKYAERHEAALGKVIEYLVEVRGLPTAIVESVVRSGDLWANKWGSCVFAHRTLRSDIEGCSIRATSGNFKQTLGNKKSAWFSAGTRLNILSQSITLVESPIDALSYLSLSGNTDETVISTAGAAEIKEILDMHRPLTLAQDNDAAGNEQADTCATLADDLGINWQRVLPPEDAKDWNDAVLKLRNIQSDCSSEISDVSRSAESNSTQFRIK